MPALVAALVALVLLPSASLATPLRVERARHLMGTTLSLTLEGEDEAALQDAADAAFQEVDRLERLLSNWREDSEVSRLNASAGEAPQTLSPELAELLETSLAWAARTDGAFDPAVEPLVDAYDLRGAGRWPSEAEQASALAASGSEHVRLDTAVPAAAVAPGAGVDLGGIGKGYALDRAGAVLRERGIECALLNFGGQVLALGAPQGEAGWTVPLASADARDRASVRLLLRDASASTSSQTERALQVGGRPLGHVLDPRTGRPVEDWGSATAVATRAVDADAASTALLVMGPEAGSRWIASQAECAALFQSRAVSGSGIVMAGGHAGLLAAAAETETGSAAASDAPSNEELARRIDVLAAEMEDRSQEEVAQPTTSKYGLAPAASRVYSVRRGPSIAGYGEGVFIHHASTDESGAAVTNKDQFDWLRLVTYLGYKFSDDLLFNSEIEFEHASTGKGGEVSVEFAYLDFLLQSAINARAGMLLMPVGWLNELHEPPVFLGVSRPETEQVVLPTTWRGNGAGVFGEPGSGFSYRAYVVEGLRAVRDTVAGFPGYSASSGIRNGRQSGARSLVEDWAGTARLDWSHTAGLTLGASVVSGGSAQGYTSGGAEFSARTTSWDAHGEYRAHGAWLRALYAETSVDEADLLNQASGLAGNNSVGSKMYGWYAVAGYDVLRLLAKGSELSLYPYLQYEEVDTQKEVPSGYARAARNEREFVTFGASFYPHSQVALKADYQWRSNGAATEVDRLQMAVTYLF